MDEIRIVMPIGALGASASDGLIDTAMRIIGVGFGSDDEWPSKYGTNFENDVFMMHPYCWCESQNCLWCGIWLSNEVTCTEDEAEAHRLKQQSELRRLYGDFAADRVAAPNFWFKPSNFQLTWYKYIGRDMETNGAELPSTFLHQLFATHPDGMTVDQAIEALARREAASAAQFRRIFEDALNR